MTEWKETLRSLTLVVFAAASGGLVAAHAQTDLPAHWTRSTDGQVQVYATQTPSGTMTLRLMPWTGLDGESLEDWLTERWEEPFGPIRVANRSGSKPAAQIQRREGREYQFAIAARHLRTGGASSMLAACAQNGSVMVSNYYGPSAGLAYGPATNEATQLLERRCAQGPDNAAETVAPPPPRNRPSLAKGVPPKGFDKIWYIGDFVPDVSGMRGVQKAVMTFSDGAVSDDIDLIFAEGRASSARKNPGDWGRWRLNAEGDLEIKWSGSADYDSYYLTRQTDSGGADKRLNACFSSRTGYSIGFGAGAAQSMSVKKWCFSRDGRFTTDEAVSVSGGTGGAAAGYAGSDRAGHYRIDGHVIQLIFDNGVNLTTSFAMMDENDPDKTTDLFLGSRHFD